MRYKKLKMSTWLAILISMTSILQANISYAECSPNLNTGIQKIIDDDRIKYKIPGIEVSISCPEESTLRDFVSGTTIVNGEILVNRDNLFQIGSETKSFTAAIILQLEAEGKLSIYDSIGKYLQNIPNAWKNITIQQLLNHTSGIFNYTETTKFSIIEQGSDFKKQWLPDELINLVINKPLYFNPGNGFHYSNTNYILAGMIIHVVTGNSVEKEIKTRLIAPLQLSHSHYLPYNYDTNIMQQMAHGYYLKHPNAPFTDATDYNMSMAQAAGAIVSTSHDTATWFKTLLTTNTILPEPQRNEMMTLVDEENGQPLPITSHKDGYGLAVEHGFLSDSPESEIWTHNGGTWGYQSNMLWLKCNNIILSTIISANTDESNIGFLLMDLVNYIQKTDTFNQCNGNIIQNKSTLLKHDR